ncbi:MAG: adenine phosphoribosyltransferase [Verrucomicrobiaceae bacterium]|jgi:adenine phosphoribosyltransferase|nr:adenine phosphoribosyltransferase [Verrucomicrobiales bacterium]NCF91945.1 adenine phosphoribosyltransferase [Verrucomicrobiaceae bacterium]
MNDFSLKRLNDTIRDVPDFPKPGILFKDITPVLADPEVFSIALDAMEEKVTGQKIDKIIGIDARGFIFGAALADRMKAGFIPLRKKGKLPYKSHEVSYSLEYGEATIEIHEDAVSPGERVYLVDDLLATGGTAAAAIDLIGRLKGDLVAVTFLVELAFLNGREKMKTPAPVHSILTY